MRRLSGILVLSVLLPLLDPVPAHAWWEYIEQLSGPGPFKGWSLDIRFACFIDPDGDGVLPAEPHAASALEAVTASCRLQPGEVRRASIDLGMRFVRALDDADFANARRINLTTFAPAMSWNLIPGSNYDILDYGVAAGVYWFTSTEFPSFRGAFIEPIRLDFHAPSVLNDRKWAAVIPRVRVALLGFPGGFETSRFAAAQNVPPRISRDWVLNVGIFANLEALLP